MARGIAHVSYLESGVVHNVYEGRKPGWDFIYEASTTRNPLYHIGDRVVLPDGREFRYAKSVGTCDNAQGCEFTYTGYVSWTAFAVAASIGDTSITVPAATHAALTEDDLRGGYVVIFDGVDDSHTQFRGIIGNASADADAAFVLYLDGALTYAITAGTSTVEVYRNPYAALRTATLDSFPKAGVPATYVSATATYFWVQVKGPIWLPPQSGVGDDQGQKGAFWRHDGSLDKADTALATTVPNGSTSQYAGYCLAGSQSGNGPLFNLQG